MSLRRSAVFLAVCLLWGWPARAAERYAIDRAHSNVGFAIRFTGLTSVEGKFTDVAGALQVEDADLTKSSVTAVIRTDSLITGVEDRDKHLKSPDFFGSEKFPVILFQSTRVEKKPDGYWMVGNLSMHGVTKEVTFPFTFVGKVTDAGGHARLGFEGHLKLNRQDFGITGGAWWEEVKKLGIEIVADEADIGLKIQAMRWNYDRLSYDSHEKPSIGELLERTIVEKGLDAGLTQYTDLKQQQPDAYNFGPEELNLLGRRLLAKKRPREAVAVFQLNTEAFPQATGVYVALADALRASGDTEAAEKNYRKALELDPFNPVALEMTRQTSGG